MEGIIGWEYSIPLSQNPFKSLAFSIPTQKDTAIKTYVPLCQSWVTRAKKTVVAVKDSYPREYRKRSELLVQITSWWDSLTKSTLSFTKTRIRSKQSIKVENRKTRKVTIFPLSTNRNIPILHRLYQLIYSSRALYNYQEWLLSIIT